MEAQRTIKEYKNCVVGQGASLINATWKFYAACIVPNFEPEQVDILPDCPEIANKEFMTRSEVVTWYAPSILMEYDGPELIQVTICDGYNPVFAVDRYNFDGSDRPKRGWNMKIPVKELKYPSPFIVYQGVKYV